MVIRHSPNPRIIAYLQGLSERAKLCFVGLGCGAMLGTSLLTLLPEAASAMKHVVLGGLLLAGVFLGMGIEILVRFLHKSRAEPNDKFHTESIQSDDEVVYFDDEPQYQPSKKLSVRAKTKRKTIIL